MVQFLGSRAIGTAITLMLACLYASLLTNMATKVFQDLGVNLLSGSIVYLMIFQLWVGPVIINAVYIAAVVIMKAKKLSVNIIMAVHFGCLLFAITVNYFGTYYLLKPIMMVDLSGDILK